MHEDQRIRRTHRATTTLCRMSHLTLNAEALYLDLLREMKPLLATYPVAPRLVGVASGGA